MTGVEILTTEQVLVETSFNWIAALVVGLVTAGVFIVLYIVFKDICDMVDGVCSLVVIFLLAAVSGLAFATPSQYVNQYQVIVSDEVVFTEFCERYEIVDQDGKLLTVREKDIDSSIEK